MQAQMSEFQDVETRTIALLPRGFIEWVGGLDFLRLCISALSVGAPGATWNIMSPQQTVRQRLFLLAMLAKRRLTTPPWKPIQIPFRASESQLRESFASVGAVANFVQFKDTNATLLSAMQRIGARVVFPCSTSLGKSFPIAWVGYIPDLQHKRLPHLFTRRERWQRDLRFTRLLAEAREVIVNSRAAASDIELFYPNSQARLISLPFCPPLPPRGVDAKSIDDALAKYQIRKPYFLISNQFWMHKSHETAFAALRLVREAKHDVSIVCTGHMQDYRSPRYFDKLIHQITHDRLTDQIRFLGLIPKREQLGIMKSSVAVIQPTLFEGGPGGGAVYDAVSTGTPAIVSDIDVNKEIDLGVVSFFRAGSAEDLATQMIAALTRPPNRLTEEQTAEMLSQRRWQMGTTLLDVLAMATRNDAAGMNL